MNLSLCTDNTLKVRAYARNTVKGKFTMISAILEEQRLAQGTEM